METDPQPVVELVSITTNADIIETTPVFSTTTDNDMEIYNHAIEGTMSLSNSLFVEEEQKSWPNPNNLD